MTHANLAKIRTLSVFAIVMITVTSVDSIRNLPATALFGAPLIFFFLLGALFFLVPGALVSAELSSGWPQRGGVYLWVKEAFGVKWGFLAIWFQWVENMIWYPTILSFLAGTAAYVINPDLAANKYYLLGVILVTYWLVTLINLRGLHASAFVSVFCGITGLFIPMALIIVLGFVWVFSGKPLQISFAFHNLLPNFSDPTLLVSMTAVLLSYSGIEIATVHAREAKDPQRDFPRALVISTIIIAVTLILGSLAIAVVVPNDQLNLVSGIMQAFSNFLNAYHLGWAVPVVVVFIILGTIAGINNWTLAPIRGLLVAAQDGNLPPALQRENQHLAPTTMLLIQAMVVSIVSTVFIFMPTINSSYWVLTVISAQLYMIMYLIMFAAAIRLRYKYPHVQRSFKIMGGNVGMWIVSGVGFIMALFTFVIGFVPPSSMGITNIFHYETLIFVVLFAMSVPPFIIYAMRKPHWKEVANLHL
jgi:putative glutamate/gamma-aminobutyrate antiporter